MSKELCSHSVREKRAHLFPRLFLPLVPYPRESYFQPLVFRALSHWPGSWEREAIDVQSRPSLRLDPLTGLGDNRIKVNKKAKMWLETEIMLRQSVIQILA